MQDVDDEGRNDYEIGVVEGLDEENHMGNDADVEESGPGGEDETKNDDNMDSAGPDVQGEADGDDRVDVAGCEGEKGGREES